jgi:RNA polymerase sigma factor (sigma-70 family)
MSTHRLATAELVRLFETGSLSGLSEWQLLERFVAHRDELAFQVLVSRHGPMVLGICRRMLANAADVEDAFQATFLVLLRRAGSLGPGDAIAAWLHGVAVRVAQQARSAAARRGQRERLGMAVEVAEPNPTSEDSELRRILDEEINRLPLKYRAPIVLCYLEGQTHEEAARQLHWPLGTVKGRLARARSLLESRLARRGVACGTGLAALAACSSTEAAVPASLVASTCNAATRIGSGTLIAHVVSASIAQLIHGVLSAMILQRALGFGTRAISLGS